MPLMMLAVGRLHPVKDHAFLLRACHQMRVRGTDFLCLVAGEGPERPWLEHLIRNLRLEGQVKLLGHLGRQQLDAWYAMCDLVVLTSRSEGIPLVLMEAMAHAQNRACSRYHRYPGTGQGRRDRVPVSTRDRWTTSWRKIEMIHNSQPAMARLRRAARQHVLEHFNREKNLASLADLLVSRIARNMEHDSHENPVLQQI